MTPRPMKQSFSSDNFFFVSVCDEGHGNDKKPREACEQFLSSFVNLAMMDRLLDLFASVFSHPFLAMALSC